MLILRDFKNRNPDLSADQFFKSYVVQRKGGLAKVRKRFNGLENLWKLYDEMKEALSEALFHNRLRGRAHQAQLRNNLANTLQRFVSRKLGINPTVMGTVIHLDPSVTRAEGGKRKR